MLITNIAFAYPNIISERGINHTQAKQLVYSVPEQYFKYVNSIEFVINPINCGIIDKYGQKRCYDGWSQAYWDKNHNWYKGKIILKDISRSLLVHEISHIIDFCVNKVNVSTEEFADNFRIEKWKMKNYYCSLFWLEGWLC